MSGGALALLAVIGGGVLLAAAWGIGLRRGLPPAQRRRAWWAWGGGFALMMAGILWDTRADTNADAEEVLALGTALALMIGGATLLVLRRARAHAAFSALSGLLLAVGAVLAPAIATQRGLNTTPDTPVVETPAATLTAQERALLVFNRVTAVIAAQTGLDAETVAQNLDAGISVAQMAREAGADLNTIVLEISAILREQVENVVADGRMDEFQASLLISQMPLIVRLGVETDLAGALSRFDAPEATPTGE